MNLDPRADLVTLLRSVVDVESVSGNEKQLADLVEDFALSLISRWCATVTVWWPGPGSVVGSEWWWLVILTPFQWSETFRARWKKLRKGL